MTTPPVRVQVMDCQSSSTCPSFGVRREVPLQVVAPGVLARPAFLCADCGMELFMITEGGGER